MDGTSNFSTVWEWNEALEFSLTQILPKLFQHVSGVLLQERKESVAGEWNTTCTLVSGRFPLALAVHLSEKLLWRATCGALSSDYVGREDMEEFEQEFFNVLAGRLLSELCWPFDGAVGLRPPSLAPGRYFPGSEGGVGGMRAYSAGDGEELELQWQFSVSGDTAVYDGAPSAGEYGKSAGLHSGKEMRP